MKADLVLARRTLVLGAAALGASGLLSACDGANGAGAAPGDMALGPEDARVTLIEYASVTCPHCREFHETVMVPLKADYIDAGKLRFIFREFPTPPAQVALAGFQLARCGGADAAQYFNRIDALFSQQSNIIMAMQATGAEGVREKLIEIGAATGLSADQVTACISDEAGAQRVRETVDSGRAQFNITGTPTLILNGEKLSDPEMFTYEGLSARIDSLLAE